MDLVLRSIFKSVEFQLFILTQTGSQWKEIVKTILKFRVP